MAKRSLLISLIIIILTTGYLGSGTYTSAGPEEAAQESSKMLNATVLITMYGYDTGDTVQAEGLGTLVEYDESLYIVTHDHWSLLQFEIELVQVRDWQGELLAQVNGPDFLSRIHYRDGGTMVLEAPAGIEDQVAAISWNSSPAVQVGDTVQIVHRNEGGKDPVTVTSAVVEAVQDENGVRSFILKTEGGRQIVRGDSGGGIWSDGDLAGNMWLSLTVTRQSSASTEANWAQAAVLVQAILEAASQAQPVETPDVDAIEASAPGLAPVVEAGGIG